MCKKRELTEESLIIDGVNRPIGERSIQTLMSKQLALMALIDTMTITMDTEKGKTVFREIVSIMKELENMNATCTCGLN
jgi:hypothetical protein